MISASFFRRRDMTQRDAERWRPPLFRPVSTRGEKAVAAVRRFFDLQAGSLWRDLREILPASDGIVLDVGCGAQPYRSLLGTAAQYVGIDTDQARAHFGYTMPDVIYYAGDRWPIGDASIDVVLCTETLEHVAHTGRFLSEMGRVLRPGGQLILTVPFAARYHFIPHDYWRFTPASLQQLLTAACFQNVAVFARGNAVTVACYKVMALIFPLLFASSGPPVTTFVRFVVGVALSPVVLLLAVIANLSLFAEGGDDCLGYTVLANRAA